LTARRDLSGRIQYQYNVQTSNPEQSTISHQLPVLKMRQRITFLQEPQDSLDPKLLHVERNSIATKYLKAAREDKITFSLDELPQELYLLLKASHELHIRWSSSRSYETIAPLVSRLSPGLHVFWTPQRNRNSSYAISNPALVHADLCRSLLCSTLKKAFGDLDCISAEVPKILTAMRIG
jgi:hypothetical protein